MKTFKSVQKYLKVLILLFLFVVNFFVWSSVFAQENQNKLKVAFLDVGQGDAIFIETPSGNQILIDGGADKKVLRELSKIMPFHDRSIDIVIISHPDKDHIGGLPSVFENYEISAFVEPGVGTDTDIYNILKNLVKKENSKIILARSNMVFNLDKNIFLKILFPDRDVSGMDTNDASVIAHLVYGNSEFLFTGDSPQKIEKYLVSLGGEKLNSDVLKIGHHGSKTSSSKSFVGFVSPEYAVISVGADNKYGHPNQEVINILNEFGVKILKTSESGTIIFETDGELLNLFQ
ncbi:MBL fold metallo-hydrolase [Patescibacteria group bacterium]|nr:MBL fold metallo-hydrolase [Patescibacteria group bacterium]MBU4115616.1 MBL fold metallo-hydrolase [Patescibacteria group bacterium]